MIYETIEELMIKAQAAEGKTFGEIDTTGRIKNLKSKGTLGNIIEESYFGYEINSASKPDFENLGVELKVTPFKKNKNGTYSAKERLVLNIIDYMNEFKLTFETSSFMSKAAKMLIMLYQYEPDVDISDYQIFKAFLNEFSEEDLAVMRRDWKTIVTKIRSGEAHLISEADTMYLSASTKGANKLSVRPQPYSTLGAKQRAFSLKASYMTGLIRKCLTPEYMESFSNKDELQTKSLEEILNERFMPHYGKRVDLLCSEMGIKYNPNNKSMVPHLMARLLGVKKNDISDIEEFSKANIKFKTVGREPDDSIREHMSFKRVNFDTLLNEEWEDGELYQLFAERKYLFLIFRYTENYKPKVKRIPFFEGIKLWNMPQQTIEGELYNLWVELKKVVDEGVELIPKGRRVFNNLPGPSFNGVSHVRPKAGNGKDKTLLPDGQWITKQSYWLDREYIQEILDDE
ncbi:Sau3AI family type II restriction endonuclease [Rossellomorea sp. SC111]|uniref:Sau3AI family type II restriction endonuclease n=1 Tax=Rossellomorea sp. SC111 TaxID=2968985 RepID=UPI00215AE4AF|nr:Sau3AI family type II restriction endonuclease [Rossellomorea sp. SC111]MCR8848160.1 Sau3AI family type II restriction endonuclease [Rossellomorea sp. SC111]